MQVEKRCSISGKPTLIQPDFGMRIAKRTENKIWFKGYGPDPYVYVIQKGAETKFLGGTFIVESFSDLERCVCDLRNVYGLSSNVTGHVLPGRQRCRDLVPLRN